MLAPAEKFIKNEAGDITLDYLVLTSGIIVVVIGATTIFHNAVIAPADEIYVGLHTVNPQYTFQSYYEVPNDYGDFVETEENDVTTTRYERK